MTKPTQQQRREKKKQCKQTHNNSDNYKSHVSEYEDFVSSNIKSVYPNANVINMTSVIHSYENVISNVKKLSEYTRDDNNIIIVYNINILHFTKFYSCYMSLKKEPVHTWSKIDDDIIVMLVRSNNVILAPKPEIGNSDVFKNVLKSYLKPRVNDCLICFHEFIFNERRVSCCHCQMPMCKKCFITYIKNNSGWCPYCTQHLIYLGLDKTCIQGDDMDVVFNTFVGDEMRTRINQTNAVTSVPASYLAEKWTSFVNGL